MTNFATTRNNYRFSSGKQCICTYKLQKTTHFRFGGDRWFRACWEVSQSLKNAEISAATRFVESLKICITVRIIQLCFLIRKHSIFQVVILIFQEPPYPLESTAVETVQPTIEILFEVPEVILHRRYHFLQTHRWTQSMH